MAKVIVAPAELVRFAHRLAEHVELVRNVRRSLSAGLDALHATWRDERYLKFENEFTATAAELDRFAREAERYVGYLEAKASKARRYLDR